MHGALCQIYGPADSPHLRERGGGWKEQRDECNKKREKWEEFEERRGDQ